MSKQAWIAVGCMGGFVELFLVLLLLVNLFGPAPVEKSPIELRDGEYLVTPGSIYAEFNRDPARAMFKYQGKRLVFRSVEGHRDGEAGGGWVLFYPDGTEDWHGVRFRFGPDPERLANYKGGLLVGRVERWSFGMLYLEVID